MVESGKCSVAMMYGQVPCVVAPRVLIAVAFEETGILWSRFCGSIAMVIETGKWCGSAMCGRDCVAASGSR